MHADEWKLSYFEFWVFKLRKMGRKLKRSLGVPILTRELYAFTRTDLCVSTCRQVVCEMLLYLALHCKIDPRRKKNDISSYIWHRSFKRQNALCLMKKSFIKGYMVCRLCLVIFYFEEKCCVLHASARLVWRLLPVILSKNYISGFIWHKSFIQMVKCCFSY